MANSTVVVSNTTPSGQLVDSNGKATFALLKWMQNIGATINQGFDQQGNYQGPIGSRATIIGRKYLATIVQHLSDLGIIDSAGLPAATDAAQGAVVLPAGATSNILGSAATKPTSAFDAAGSAAAAQVAAQGFATIAAATAQSNAEANAAIYTNTAIATAFSPGISVVITTAKLTTGGTNGSMTFADGLLIGQVAAT